jgi:hypothetical protein
MVREIELSDGKYTIQYNEVDATIRVLRYGEIWQDFDYSNFMWSFIGEFERLQANQKQEDNNETVRSN